MKMYKELLINVVILFVLFCITNGQGSIFCSKEFCDSYLATETCIKLPDACKIQNSTHNGVFLPHPGPCNCCPYCLENQGSGSSCSVGDPSFPMPTLMCGAGLSCQPSPDGPQNTCQIMITACTDDQKNYDQNRKDGTLGHLEVRPGCDPDGTYAPYTCIPGEICYCTSTDGRRIFGEIPYTSNVHPYSGCKCSRDRDEWIRTTNAISIFQDQFFRCTSNGDYDTIQCIDEENCLCVDSENGYPIYKQLEPINMTLISSINMPCFNNETHKEAEYYHNCEEEYVRQASDIKLYMEQGFDVIGYTLPDCQPDGRFFPVQKNSTAKFCVNPDGDVLEDFVVPLTSSLATLMDCKCARTRNIMNDGEKPTCCQNGNYQKMQCRRGLCRCVNENGIQIEKEVDYVDRTKLNCYNNMCAFP